MAENIEIIRPINLPEAQQLSENDVFVLDSETGGVRKIPKNKVYTPVDDTLSVSGEAADAKVTGEKIDELKAETALIQNPVGNKSGELVSFSDGADMPAKSVVVNIEPQQSGTGTPSPDNVRTISGWESVVLTDAGKNLIDAPDITLSSAGYAYNGVVNLPATTLTISWDSTINSASFAITDENGTAMVTGSHVLPYTFTLPKPAKSMKLYVAGAGTFKNIQIEEGTTATAYEPYNGTTTTVNLGRTVYGGTLDVVSGVLTVTHKGVVYDGSSDETWGVEPQAGTQSFYIARQADAKALSDVNVENMLYSTFPFTKVNWIVGECRLTAYYYNFLAGSVIGVTTVEEWRTWLSNNPLSFTYELATPQTYQLTPTEVNTLLGENNVWADAGDVDVTYRKDINIVIDELTNAIVSLGSNV